MCVAHVALPLQLVHEIWRNAVFNHIKHQAGQISNGMDRMERFSAEMGLSVNRSKTKILVVDRSGKLELTGALDLETVDNFVYLGSNISNNGSCEKEVRRRIGMAKNAMSQLERIWRDRNISVNLSGIILGISVAL